MTREEEIMKAARVYADGIAQHLPNKKYCEEDFIAGVKWADAHPHWISVEDELPKEEGWILICSYSDVDMWYYNGQTAKDLMDYANITHWLPLPQPPKKGGGE